MSFFVALCAVASLAAACDESPAAPSPVTASQLAGTWTVVSVQPAGQAVQPVPAGAPYTLSFADGRVSARVDCNSCSGAFALSGETLTVGPALACTRAACPTMAFEEVYVRVLTGDSTTTLSGNTLVLSSARGVVRLAR